MASRFVYNLNQSNKFLEQSEQADNYSYSFVYLCYLWICTPFLLIHDVLPICDKGERWENKFLWCFISKKPSMEFLVFYDKQLKVVFWGWWRGSGETSPLKYPILPRNWVWLPRWGTGSAIVHCYDSIPSKLSSRYAFN